MTMHKEMRDKTINWLNNNRGNGAFDGFPEESMVFEDLSDDELRWYFYNWVAEDENEPFGMEFILRDISDITHSKAAQIGMKVTEHEMDKVIRQVIESEYDLKEIDKFLGLALDREPNRKFYCEYNSTREELYVFNKETEVQECMFPIEALEGHYIHDILLNAEYDENTIEQEMADWVIDNASDFLADQDLL